MASRRRLVDLLARHHPPIDEPLTALSEFRVLVDGAVMTNPDSQVRSDARIVVKPRRQPQGVRKLGHALDAFGVEVEGRVALDLGACTGGFTLALLDRGAAQVYAVDVGFGQLLGSLQQDSRVTSLERTNLSSVTPVLLTCQPDIVVADLTKLTLRDVGRQLADNRVPAAGTVFVGLVKPMFELGLGALPTTRADLDKACRLASEGLIACGWQVLAVMESEVRGHGGAVEFFVHARWPDRSELLDESQIVVGHDAHVRDGVEDLSEAVDAETEREP